MYFSRNTTTHGPKISPHCTYCVQDTPRLVQIQQPGTSATSSADVAADATGTDQSSIIGFRVRPTPRTAEHDQLIVAILGPNQLLSNFLHKITTPTQAHLRARQRKHSKTSARTTIQPYTNTHSSQRARSHATSKPLRSSDQKTNSCLNAAQPREIQSCP